jgi:hypothetical protein
LQGVSADAARERSRIAGREEHFLSGPHPDTHEVKPMCFEYYERMQRLEDQRRREQPEQKKPQADKDLEPSTPDRTEWKAPEEPARIREKVPA